MRITACRIEAFGSFRTRVFDGLDHPVVVIQGPNEAGKTTLFYFFREMLYGLEPADVARHPYAPPENGRPLGGQLRYRQADGALRTVHRRLMSAPQARLLIDSSDGERSLDLQNRPLPSVAHVSREVFSSVYAMNGRALEDGVRGTAWQEVQARLLRMVSTPSVRSTDEVVGELEAKAARLWQASDRAAASSGGKTEADRLVEQRRALREKLKRARSHDRERRALHRTIAEHTEQLEALQAERVELKARLRQAERLRPVQALVTEMDAHRERAGHLAPFEQVPEEPRPVLRRLEREIERYENEAARHEEARAEAGAARDALMEEDRQVQAEADTIRAWAKKTPAHENRVEHHEQLLRDIDQLADVLNERSRRHFGVAWSEAVAKAVRALPEDELEARVNAYRRAADAVETLEVRADALARKVDRRKRLWPWGVVFLLGIAVFVVGVMLVHPLLWGPGAGLVAAGLLQFLSAWSYNRERTERLGDLDLEIEEKTEVRTEKSAAIAELLADLPLSEDEARHPDHELVEALRDLRRQAEERKALRQQAEALAETIAEEEASVAALARRCSVPEAEELPLPQAVTALERRLQVAERRYQEAEAARARLAELRRRQREIRPALQARRERLNALKTCLNRLDEDTGAAVEELKARRRAARHAEQARETLFRKHPDWKALREEIRAVQEDAGAWAYTDEEVVRMRERREEAADQILEIEKQRTRKREEAERLSRAPAPADVESTLAATERRLAAVTRRRDRLALLANVLRRSAHAFRHKHQPEVIKQAGRYLRTITSGRYHHLVLEGEERRLGICQTKEGMPQPVAAPLSQGLREQVYLALRLALLDHLDQSQEALPIFLDEVFSSWDRRRRRQGYTVIEELAERRQVFIFTCHPALSSEMHQRLGAHRLSLDAPPVT